MRKTWGDLTTAQKRELAELYQVEKDPNTLAKYTSEHFDIDLRPKSVARRIREFILGDQRAKNMDNQDEIKQEYRTVHVSENELDLVYTGPTAHTLEDLLSVMQIDKEVWEVLSFTANVWEGFRAKKQQNLTFELGVMTGNILDKGGVTIVPLYQVKAKLIRRVPVLVEPVVVPIKMEVPAIEFSREPIGSQKSSRVLILPDPQFGFFRSQQMAPLDTFHDRKALSAALLLAEVLQPDEIIWLGDLLDFSEFSTFKANPLQAQTTQHALLETVWWLTAFRERVPSASMAVLEGNHDKRFSLSLMEKLPAAFGLQAVSVSGSNIRMKKNNFYDIPVLLGFDDIQVQYIQGYPNNSLWLGGLEVLHGNLVTAKPGGTVASALNKYTNSVIFGHIHRIEQAYRTLYEGGKTRTITAASPGCLCRIEGVVPGSKIRDQWQQGVGIVDYAKDRHHVSLLEIQNGTLFYNGELLDGSSVHKEAVKSLRRLVGA